MTKAKIILDLISEIVNSQDSDTIKQHYIMELCTINEMGRSREDMTALLNSLTDTLQEHIWKVFAYHKSRPQNIRGWLVSLNKHLIQLRINNIAKGKTGYNYSKKKLYDKMTDTYFGNELDAKTLNNIWSSKGYPVVTINKKDRVKLVKLSNKYVDLIFSKGKFTVTEDELL